MLVRWGVALALTCVFVVGQPHAVAQQSPKQTATAKHTEAKSLFRSGEYDQALAAVDSGLTAVPKHLKLLLLRGQILLEKRDYDGAIAAYEAFLAAGPRGANKRKARKIVKNLQVVRTTFLEVTVENGPANVYLDSTTQGVICVADPTCRKGIVPGTYSVLIERQGFASARERVKVKRGAPTAVKHTLVENNSELKVTVSPAAADISVDGASLGAGPSAQKTLAPGEHKLTVSLAAHAEHEQTVVAKLGEPIELSIVLAERVGVVVNPPETKLVLNDEPLAIVDGAVTLPEGSVGPLSVTASADGFVSKVVEIPANRQPGDTIRIELEKVPAQPETPEPQPLPEHKEWTPTKIGYLSGAGTVAAAGFVLAAVSGSRASGHKDDAEALCTTDELGLVCDSDQGFQSFRDADEAAGEANLLFALGAIGSVGVIAAYSYNEAPTADGSFTLRRKISLGVTAGISVTALAVGAIYGLRARSLWDDAERTCDGNINCDREGFINATEADNAAGVSNLSFLVAGAAAAGTAYLWLFSPDAAGPVERNPVAVSPTVIPGGGGITVRSTF